FGSEHVRCSSAPPAGGAAGEDVHRFDRSNKPYHRTGGWGHTLPARVSKSALAGARLTACLHLIAGHENCLEPTPRPVLILGGGASAAKGVARSGLLDLRS